MLDQEKKKKVIILNHGLHISGVSRTLINFANALVRNGYDVTIKVEVPNFTLKPELDKEVKVQLFLNEPYIGTHRIRGFLRLYRTLLKLVEQLPRRIQYYLIVRQKYDVEIAFNRGAAARIISASTNRKAKKLAWVHNDYMRNSNPLAGFHTVEEASQAYAAYDHVVCVSEQAEQSFKLKFGDTGNVVTCYNVMDVERILESAGKVAIPKRTFTMVAVGRLSEQKNYSLLLDVSAELERRGIDFELWIVGDGEEREELLRYKQTLSLEQVIFWGAKENPYPYFAAADLYVSSSIYEGLSTTTIEALILGKPAVVTDCTGMRDILGDSRWGVVVPIEVGALADAIERMISDKSYREYYEKQAVIRAEAFSPEACFEKIEELMQTKAD